MFKKIQLRYIIFFNNFEYFYINLQDTCMKYTNKSYFDKAKEKEEAGYYEEALEYYKKALEEDDENIELYFSINLIKSYIEIEKNTQDKEKQNKHTKLFNIFNEFLDEK